jgi:hypothetical protein
VKIDVINRIIRKLIKNGNKKMGGNMFNELNDYCKLNKLQCIKDNNRYKVQKSYWKQIVDLYDVIDKKDEVEVRYANGKVEVSSKESFIDYLKEQVKHIKLLHTLASSSRPLHKNNSYVHNKITEMGSEYCKMKSGVYRDKRR